MRFSICLEKKKEKEEGFVCLFFCSVLYCKDLPEGDLE